MAAREWAPRPDFTAPAPPVEWNTGHEYVLLELPGMPKSRMSWFNFRNDEPLFDHPAFHRRGSLSKGPRRGGSYSTEYHYLVLPLPAIVAFETRFIGYSAPDARSETGILDTAEGGLVRAFLRKRLRARPEIRASRLRAECVALFGEAIAAGRIAAGIQPLTEMPPLRTFQHFMQGHREG